MIARDRATAAIFSLPPTIIHPKEKKIVKTYSPSSAAREIGPLIGHALFFKATSVLSPFQKLSLRPLFPIKGEKYMFSVTKYKNMGRDFLHILMMFDGKR